MIKRRIGVDTIAVILVAVCLALSIAATEARAQVFAPGELMGMAMTPTSLVSGDFNEDGFDDVVVSEHPDTGLPNGIRILLGSSTGEAPSPAYVIEMQNISSMTTGDFNHDGHLDIAAVNGEQVLILLGNGDGTLQLTRSYYPGWCICETSGDPGFCLNFCNQAAGPVAVATADLNRDGNLDLVVANENGKSIVVLHGNGNGDFELITSMSYYPLTPYNNPPTPHSVSIVDFNGDGMLDILVACEGSYGRVSYFLGNGNGSFQEEQITDLETTSALAAGDFNGDGLVDLAVGPHDAYSLTNVSVSMGLGGGLLQAAVGYTPIESRHSNNMLVAQDFNSDGLRDIATAGASLLLANGNIAYPFDLQNYTTNSVYPGTSLVTAGDFNGDGKIDIAAATVHNNDGYIYVLLNNLHKISTLTDSHGGISCIPALVEDNGNSTCTVTPNVGYTINSVDGCGGVLAGNVYSISNITADCTVTASFNLIPDYQPLNVFVSGSGSVTSSPSGISCKTTCSAAFDYDTLVTLTAIPGTGYEFSGWSGDPDCSDGVVTMNTAKSCTATFTPMQYTLTLNTSGTGAGTVTGAGTYGYGTHVTITATAGEGSTFTGWSGDCSGALNQRAVTMDGAKTCTATFMLNILTVSVTGAGAVNSDPAGINNCGSTCSAAFALATSVTLTANPSSGYVFTGWMGDCSGTGTCQVMMNGPKNVTASFPQLVSSVTITSSPRSSQQVNQPISLTAIPTGGGTNLEYRFWVKVPGGVMTVIPPGYGSSNTLTYTPTATGKYTFRVDVRNVGNPVDYEAVQWKAIYVITDPLVTAVSISASPASPQQVNTPITLTAAVTEGGGASIEYEFAVKVPGGTMTVFRTYGSNTASYTPTAAGTYHFRVFARNSGNEADYEAAQWVSYDVIADPPVTSVIIWASPASPQQVNTQLLITPSVTGGGEYIEYRFWVRVPGGVMTMKQDYGVSNTYTYTETTITGVYSFRVDARNVGSAVDYEAAQWRSFEITQ